MNDLALFALASSHDAGAAVAERLGLALSPAEERDFEDGEHKSRPLVSVRGRDVFVIESLYSDAKRGVNDKLLRLLFFAGALRDASAARVSLVVPYLAYARKERKTQPRDPVTTRYVAMLCEAVGVERVIALDVHDLAAFQNAFRCQTEHLEARRILVDEALRRTGSADVAVVSPDPGGIKRAELFRKALVRRLEREVPLAVMEKSRAKGVVAGEQLAGDVRGRVALLVDDLIVTGGTLVRAAQACRARGALGVLAFATHGIFAGAAGTVLADPALDAIVVTDSVPPFRLAGTPAREKVGVLETAPLLAEAIARIHDGGSLTALLET